MNSLNTKPTNLQIKLNEIFRVFAHRAVTIVGAPLSFAVAVAVIILWAIFGFWFKYSDTWQLVINTTTTIITFLMVFLLQCAQNRDSKAVQLKLDELIKAIGSARNSIIDLEQLTDEQLAVLEEEYKRLSKRPAPPRSNAEGARHKPEHLDPAAQWPRRS
jgi:low affinity Fe/Cu permease